MTESTVLKNKSLSAETLAKCYAKARVQASNETDLLLTDFPDKLSYSIEQLLNPVFFGE